MSIESVMPSNHLVTCHPHLLLLSIFPSIRVFSSESALRMRWLKYWSFSFSISPSNENSGLISFRIDWFDLLAAQGTLKSLLQHHSSKASVLWQSAFFFFFLIFICSGFCHTLKWNSHGFTCVPHPEPPPHHPPPPLPHFLYGPTLISIQDYF